ncbi:ATP-binding cassette domain-containing protein [Levilactobacillus namurensis]|uniref:ATP-binding cassette domain-containing protein n=1 Tax=Levilactobacillus namurensis TaxID=380393 RepID=UPI001DE3D5A0|nr:ATP-binding cassette domain-containing protein [Levilactobacillus namurensis]HJE44185.1 ATP-binding cassette domain-containing protein [Levilactobacillus namurensis]
MSQYALELTDVRYRKNQRTILDHVNLRIAPGKTVGLLGENGAGKTTLMRVIASVAKGARGTIAVNQQTRDVQRRALVSFSEGLQGFRPTQKLREIRDFYVRTYPDFSAKKYLDLVTFLQIDDDQRLATLSKGTREKFIIALTLARQAAVYLLDEPFSGIDSMSRRRIISSIIQWKQPEAVLIISDHYVTEIAALLDEVVILKDRTICTHKRSDQIRQEFNLGIEAFYESVYEGSIPDDEL